MKQNISNESEEYSEPLTSKKGEKPMKQTELYLKVSPMSLNQSSGISQALDEVVMDESEMNDETKGAENPRKIQQKSLVSLTL